MIDDFNRHASWSDILSPYHWTTSDGTRWTRPGKHLSAGHSASIVVTDDGIELLTVFSANAGLLAPDFHESHRTLNKYDAFRILEHDGDQYDAKTAIMLAGYSGGGRR